MSRSANFAPITELLDRRHVGAGLKHQHVDDILKSAGELDFFEVHAENYMGEGGLPHRILERIRRDYPLSIHGVGLSIGGTERLDRAHLQRLRRLIDIYQPARFSEHLAWSSHDGAFLNDLLPLPYNEISLAHVCAHVDEAQDTLGMRMLLENPSTYIVAGPNTMNETDFLRAVARRTGCGLLLDVSNVQVSAVNHGFDSLAYLESFPLELVGEFHLAGYADDRDGAGAPLLIDDHGGPVRDVVWSLYRRTMAKGCAAPTLIEWDNDVPPFSALVAEAERARAVARLDQTVTASAA